MVNKALTYVCCCVLVLLLGMPALAQNTKGDRPAPTPRESRFKTPKKSKTKSRPATQIRRQDDKSSRRAGAPPVRTRRGGEKPGKPVGPQFSKSKPQRTEKPWRGDIAGRRIEPRRASSRAWNVHPQPPQINYSSQTLKQRQRANRNPNVRRVQKMQRQSDSRPRVGRPIKPVFHKSRPQQSERAWRGDITGRRIRAQRTESMRPRAISGGGRMRASQSAAVRRSSLMRSRSSGRARNIFSGQGFYVNNRSRNPSSGQATIRPAASLPRPPGRAKGGKIVPRSASAQFLSRRSTNPWARFAKPRQKKLAADRDLAGRRLRGKNYETPRPEISNPTLNYQRRMAGGERQYKGPAGGYASRTRSGRAWRGDISHRAIRGGKSPRGTDRAFLGFLNGGGFRSATRPGERRVGKMLPGRAPGIGGRGVGTYKGNIRANRRGFGDQGEGYSGNIRSHRLLKGGGSVSGRVWNNRGMPIPGRTPGQGARGLGYTGNIKAGRRGFNDQGEGYSGNIRTRRGFNDQGEGYSGNMRRSGRRGFNDQGEGYTGNLRARGRRGFNDQGEEFTGNIRARRRGFNYQGEEFTGNIRAGRRGFNDQGEEYTGNIRARRPDKGGGSRSGKLWNNNNTPILVRTPKGESARIAGYQGNLKGRRAMQDQGEEFTGNIKARRPEKGGGSVSGKLWNNNERPIPGKDYSYARNVSRYSGDIKAKRPEKGGGTVSGILWNNNEKPIKVRVPKNEEGGDFSGNVRIARGRYARNPNSAAGSLPVEKASASSLKAGRSVRGAQRSWDYIRNPSSADEAQRTREPGRAFVRLTDYQGNFKVKRSNLFGRDDLHPDARFVKTNKNNVREEKDMLTNFKLWWARLFRKSETQPDHLKEKGGKPRYDNGEAGLWYE